MSRDPSFLPRATDSDGISPARGGGEDSAFHVPSAPPSAPKPLLSSAAVPEVPVPTAASPQPPEVHGRSERTVAPPPAKQAVDPPTDRPGPPTTSASRGRSTALHIPANGVRGGRTGGVTLLQDAFTARTSGGRWAWNGLFLTVAIAAVGGMWWVLDRAVAEERAAVAAAAKERSDVDARITRAQEVIAPYASTARRAPAAAELLARHVMWTRAFALLEAKTLPSIAYQNLAADTTGAVTVAVFAPDIRTAAEQISVLQATPGISRVDVGGMASTLDEIGVIIGVRFDLRFAIDPATFHRLPTTAPAA